MPLNATPALLEAIRRDRRALHRIPELARDLPKTVAYCRARLEETHPDVLCNCDGGLKAVYRAESPVRAAIAFRADMDALPITEETGLPFASEHPGVMHACGHDGHMANLLALARILSDLRGELKQDVVLLLQPAEENGGGAKRMVAAGALDDPWVERVYGMHVMPQVPRGKIAIDAGPVMSGVTSLDVTVRGRSGHGATPHRGADAVMAAAQALVSLQTALMRTVDPADPVVFTTGKVEAGTVRNIIASEARLECTVRAYTPETMAHVLETARRAFEGADALYGTSTCLEEILSYPPVVNTPEEVERLCRLAGDARAHLSPMSIGEDVSEFINARRGAFVFCGVGGEEPLHSSRFFYDEECLLSALNLFLNIIEEA